MIWLWRCPLPYNWRHMKDVYVVVFSSLLSSVCVSITSLFWFFLWTLNYLISYLCLYWKFGYIDQNSKFVVDYLKEINSKIKVFLLFDVCNPTFKKIKIYQSLHIILIFFNNDKNLHKTIKKLVQVKTVGEVLVFL